MKRLSFYFTLVPVFGFFPAWWRLYRHQGSAQEQAISRLAMTLAFLWLSGYILFGTAAQSSELGSLPALVGGSLWTTTYFLTCFGLMVRLSQGKSLWLPGIGQISDRLP
ncbi:hypothetical protein E1H12_05770 [Geitlerinema sp. P-1104]|uniref:hypothetical protein n=1 Tax=Geitlerinema sp. P-1104 TaxID=2546230 RepID=UPI00147778F5|nr:hypothetical protein [Geitlerinema sp. P-1104]NMG58047.1 hypothetical protein [Geitlerinema sp. P-1104]